MSPWSQLVLACAALQVMVGGALWWQGRAARTVCARCRGQHRPSPQGVAPGRPRLVGAQPRDPEAAAPSRRIDAPPRYRNDATPAYPSRRDALAEIRAYRAHVDRMSKGRGR